MKKPVLIGITGGTGSGKSTVANAIYNSFGEKSICMISQDSYYKDQSHLSFEDRVKTNYDHPMAFDTDLLIDHLQRLLAGQPIEMPTYDFTIHNRTKEVKIVEPRDIIIVEGILVLDDKRLRDLLDIKIYVDTDADIRILRRLVRDIEERGRSVSSVVDQYLSVVRPMHMQFTEPSKRYADLIIPEGGHNKVAIDVMVRSVKALIED
ncbi:uridine kinase [Proteiniclasticum sp. QWL-01]|uniref:uridine kinase n=1 Tax=Proteiniclasticum sp. QWL-01 TaxID=3036945 RepID=UPI0022078355|nr:uridine kinase [Proteiniclasticum sp. QWL-01]UUM12953.1 uridine kinase [Clostridiaceae bacterium HFYG-1003]WFF74498.1 uridine kinase [Proteiniclasticum sp. QWL-01]